MSDHFVNMPLESASIEPVIAKFNRANEHRESFARTFREFLNKNPYLISVEFDCDTRWHSLRWHVIEPFPGVRLGLIFGDMLCDLRATLDYLIWQLVVVNGNRPTRSNAFPIRAAPGKKWDEDVRIALRGVDVRWIEAIEKLQPYHRTDEGTLPERDLLYVLDYVNNINKHRTLPIAVVGPHKLLFGVLNAGLELNPLDLESFADRPIEDGADAFRLRDQTGRQLQINVDSHQAFRVSFRDGTGLDWTNDQMAGRIGEILNVFAPAFGATLEFQPVTQ